MTLILGLECADGLLLASDGQATIGTTGQPLKGPTEKLFCPWNNIAWGGSGPVGMIQRVDLALRATFASPDAFQSESIASTRNALSNVVAGTVRPLVTDRYLNAPQSSPWASFLFVGHVPEGSFILEIGIDLLDEDHTASGYSAIGSGDIFAYSGLAHFNVRQHNLNGAKLIAHRVVDDAIRVAAYGLGYPIHMVEIHKPSGEDQFATAQKLSQDEVRILGDKVTEWKGIESEALAQFVGLAMQEPEGPGQTTLI